MRNSIVTLVPCIVLLASPALAQHESAAAAMQEHKPGDVQPIDVVIEGKKKSPAFTQTHQFSTTRTWRLDAGEQSASLWYTQRFKKDGVAGENTSLWQLEHQIGVVKGLQLDTYVGYAYDQEMGPHIDGAAVETRIAPWDYGQIWSNPVLYLEYKARNRSSSRGEVRLLLGGELGTPHLRGAINPFYEQNLDSPTGASADFTKEVEAGVTGALSYAFTPKVAAGVEARAAGEQQGADPADPDALQHVLRVGPALWANLARGHFFVVGTALFGMTEYSDAFSTTLVLGVR
jgi:hypothetical protein